MLPPDVRQVAERGSLDEFFQLIVSVEGKKRETLFFNGDLIAARLGAGIEEKRSAFWGAMAEHLGSSAAYCRDLHRVALAFDEAQRSTYPDKQWSWFKECARDAKPHEALEAYQEMSVRQVQDLRRSRKMGDDSMARRRFVVTLMGDALRDLRDGKPVTVGSAVPLGEGHSLEVRVTVVAPTVTAWRAADNPSGEELVK